MFKRNDECDFGFNDGSGNSITIKDEIALVNENNEKPVGLLHFYLSEIFQIFPFD